MAATDLEELASKAAAALNRQIGVGASATLHEPTLLKDQTRCLVVRCRAGGVGPADVSSSVIVKQLRDDPARGFTDWASLAYLSGVPAAVGLVPRFLGGDRDAGLFVMEDLGGTRSLQDVLTEGPGEGADAHAVLETLAARMAHLHAATLVSAGQNGAAAAAFEAIRNALPAAGEQGRHAEARAWLANSERLEEWLRAAGCSVPAEFERCLSRISDIYAEPGPLLAFTHGDPAPTNNHIDTDGNVRLLDFEYGGFRHALYDITAWNVLCPLPSEAIARMARRFREELTASCPTLRDEAAWDEAWGALCAYRALAILTWVGPDVLNENRPWVDKTWTARHAVLAAVERMHAASAEVASLTPAAEAARVLAAAMCRRWPEFDSNVDVSTLWNALEN